ncbi:MAG: hypothetical protein KC621_25725 [Myxococcales bacterium]|nr:hypothetical protein [Myxococcales bacterium]
MRWWLLFGVLAAGCERAPSADTVVNHETGPTDTGTTTDTQTTDPTVCVSGTTWTGGDRESPLMHPGMDCIACHTSRNEGPNLIVAGTVYSRLHEPDDCNGRSGIVVEITGDDGQVFEATTNPAGNFFLYAGTALVTPYTARVLVDGVEAARMIGAQTEGSCGSCHTVDGAEGAPGRIVVGDP